MYKASANKVKLSARKARLVVDLIRGMNVNKALGVLDSTSKKASPIVKQVLKSAIANAEVQNSKNLDVDQLKVVRAFVDEGQTLKRFHPRAYGRGAAIRKRSSRITLYVG
ncbi:MAG: 50S ribosomal protein L22 [Deltaproteobacteria bacterium]|nr:50S ribosomal protein L22 [Deltaproteobacteria bacterium]